MKHFGLPVIAIALVGTFILIGISIMTYNSLTPLGEVTNTQVNIYNALPANCSFTIYSGTNQVSFFCIPNGISIDEVLGNNSFDVLRTYQASGSDKWKIYNPSLPSWVVQDLEFMERTKGYFIETDTTQNFNYEGSKRVPNSIPIIAGWNFVGYPTDNIQSMPGVFSTIDGNYNEVRTYNNSEGVYYVFIPPASGNLSEAAPDYAYWIYATSSDTWVVS